MKFVLIFLQIVFLASLQAQMLPIDFESDITVANFVDFDGGEASVIANPEQAGENTSETVAQIVRSDGAIWSGSKINLAANLDFTTATLITMKVYTTAPAGTTVKFKLEGDGSTERDVQTTVSGAWETLTWDFTGAPANFSWVVFMFDFGNVGDGSATSTFLFDDVEQVYGGIQIDWPVNFENPEINYTMSDFGGNSSELVIDPTDPSNHVIKAIKTTAAATWAGTTIGTPAGFATDIPLTLSNSRMYVKVWSPDKGIPVRLKVEDDMDPTHTCETQTLTTVAEEWETIEFDFANQALGTESLSVGLQMGWKYNMASIFFNFDTEGSVAGEKTYYFDNVAFGSPLASAEDVEAVLAISVFPNPTAETWTIRSEGSFTLTIYAMNGRQVYASALARKAVEVDATDYESGVYIAKLASQDASHSVLLVKH